MDWIGVVGILNLTLLGVALVFIVRQEMRDRERIRAWTEMENGLRNAVRTAALEGQQGVERRIGEFEKAVGSDSAALREILLERFAGLNAEIVEQLAAGRSAGQLSMGELKEQVKGALAEHGRTFEQRQGEALKALQDSLRAGTKDMRTQVSESLSKNAEELGKRVEQLTERTDGRLKEISGQVEKRLAEGFEKTTETFISVLQHLERIDEAQKKITELSGNVVSLQEVLTDKRSRGAFGEVQLNTLVRNVMPESAFELQKSLSNGTRVDCMLFLPAPTGSVSIDAKFPLENYRTMVDPDGGEQEKAAGARLFKQDVKKHIKDIAEKYIIPGETADGAMMFLPAEAVFAEIHAHHPDLVEFAQHNRVWMVSPTTLMAILTTAGAVLKDEATRRQVHIIQDHLRALSGDFGRFEKRMDNLAKHIDLAHRDVKDVHTSAGKISSRFSKIEKVDLEEGEAPVGLLTDSEV
jgi:DNA recombination protein RmuC